MNLICCYLTTPMLSRIKERAIKLFTSKRVRRLEDKIEILNTDLDALRSRIDVGDDLFEKYQKERSTEEYRKVYEIENPLITVCIATYNRGRILVERSLKSVLEQTYKNFEVIVVGDCCTDNTEELMASIKDKRVRFVNLPERGKYPEDPKLRWMVAGTATINHALSLAKGDFITHLDDDDEYLPDRIERLVNFIKMTKADLVWHPFWHEAAASKWRLHRAEHFKKSQITTSCVFYHRWFRCIPWDINAYKYLEPGDWNRFRKIRYLGASLMRFNEPLLKHYAEKNQ